MGEAKRRYLTSEGLTRTSITDDDHPNRLVVHTEMDLEPVLDSIARDRALMRNDGDMKLTHRLPLIIYERLKAQGIADDENLFRVWLNSSEATEWRIWEGKSV